jgi:hypothetical protein
LYNEPYPNYKTIFESDNLNLWPVPENFYKGIRAIESFSQNGHVFFEDGAVSSNLHKEEASTYQVEGLPERMGFSIKHLLSVEHAFKKAHFDSETNKVVFYGEGIRGGLAGLDVKEKMSDNETYYVKAEPGNQNPSYEDDDIPF